MPGLGGSWRRRTLAPETPAEQRDKDQLITGQALNSRITSQDDIDDMLA